MSLSPHVTDSLTPEQTTLYLSQPLEVMHPRTLMVTPDVATMAVLFALFGLHVAWLIVVVSYLRRILTLLESMAGGAL